MKIFLCGDVMTGRGVDQILKSPSHPAIYESYVRDARDYVRLAERKNGHISRGVDTEYIWGDFLPILQKEECDLKIMNLETAITSSMDPWKGKGINYKMSPSNIDVIKCTGVDVCVLANNHILDWEYTGLLETMQVLKDNGIAYTGVGHDDVEASQPYIHTLNDNTRVLVFGVGMPNAGVPFYWRATPDSPGANVLDLSVSSINKLKRDIENVKTESDIIVVSIHWGPNWGYEVDPIMVEFAHRLVDDAKVDIVHGHSSHHFKPIEIYNNKLILYGCGDFINDYEGISGHEEYRGDLSLMYVPEIDIQTGNCISLSIFPFQIYKLSLRCASENDAEWIMKKINHISSCQEFEMEYTEGTTKLIAHIKT